MVIQVRYLLIYLHNWEFQLFNFCLLKFCHSWPAKRIKLSSLRFSPLTLNTYHCEAHFFSHFHALFRVGLKPSSLSSNKYAQVPNSFLSSIITCERWFTQLIAEHQTSDCSFTIISRSAPGENKSTRVSQLLFFFHLSVPMQQVRANACCIQIARCYTFHEVGLDALVDVSFWDAERFTPISKRKWDRKVPSK